MHSPFSFFPKSITYSMTMIFVTMYEYCIFFGFSSTKKKTFTNSEALKRVRDLLLASTVFYYQLGCTQPASCYVFPTQ